MFGFKHFRKNVLGVWDKAMLENVCDRLEAAAERGRQIWALDRVSMAISAFVKILVEFDSLGLNALPNLLSFADHLSLQIPLFCDKKNRWGNNHRKLNTYTLKQHMFGKLTQIQKQTNHLQWLRHCCKTRTPMILTFTFYHSNFVQWGNSCELGFINVIVSFLISCRE